MVLGNFVTLHRLWLLCSSIESISLGHSSLEIAVNMKINIMHSQINPFKAALRSDHCHARTT